MKLTLVRYLALLAMLLLLPQYVVAQEDVEDYRQYKFYKEEDDDVLELMARDADSLYMLRSSEATTYAQSWDYALRSLGYAPRGEVTYMNSYLFENLDISSRTSRQLSRLGLHDDYTLGISGVRGSVGGRHHHTYHGHEPRNLRHELSANLSGRSTLMSLSHRASYHLTHGDVALDDDWQLAEYLRVNTGPDLYVDGLFSNGAEAGVSLSRRWSNNSLILSAMLPWSRRSVRQATTEEAVALTQNYGYNPAWGLQGGKMRSSRINSMLAPTLVGSWQRRLGMWTTMRLSAAMEVERRGSTALSWCDAMSAMPDNYRYMPSYYTDDDASRELAEAWRYGDVRYTQIAWDELYHTNVIQSDGHAAYFVENRRTHSLYYALNLDFTTMFRGVDLEYGVRAALNSDRCFKVVDDLLGAGYLLDIDYFVRDNATYATKYRNNLQSPGLAVVEGGRFGYDYRLSYLDVSAYGIARWRMWDMDFELGAELSTSTIRRRGYFEKELFAGNRSYGRSHAVNLFPARLSLSWNYDFSSHGLDAQLLVAGDAPNAELLFLQPQYNNRLVDNPSLARCFAMELGYGFVRNRFSLDATLYASYYANECDVLHYYDDLADEYVDAVVSDAKRLNCGVELRAKAQWSQYFSSKALLNVGRHRYVGSAMVATYADNDNDLIAISRSAIGGCNTAQPELALYADVAYRRMGWQAIVSFNYVDLRYAAPSFVRRTERVYTYAHSPEEQEALLGQHSLGAATSLNISLSKRFKLADNKSIRVSLSLDNLLGAKNIASGYEQHRIREVQIAQREHVRPFANKLMYGYGRTCSLRVSFGF